MGTNGLLVIDKPKGWTSMDVCAKLRGVFHEKRVGHAGTLDPMATGVLPVFVGRATRAVQFAETGEKEYIAKLRLGVVTDTQDITGAVLAEREVSVTGAELEAVLARFRGPIEQIPPMYSAVKVQGKKLYELARKGVEVERKPRSVTIHALELLGWPDAGEDLPLRVVCSKGTYIRTLCHDIGKALGCGGCMAELRRSAACGFSLSDAVTLEEVSAHPDPGKLLRPVDSCFDAPKVRIDGVALKRALCGNPFPLDRPAGQWRVYGPDGAFLLLGQCDGSQCRVIKSFYEVEP